MRAPRKVAFRAAWYRQHGQHDHADRLEQELHQAGRCRVCGLELTDPQSVARGIGPTCWARQQQTRSPDDRIPHPDPKEDHTP